MSQGTSRPGLYVMVFLALMNSCDAATEARRAGEALKRIADTVSAAQPPAASNVQ
jgi:hypothetical protein